MQNERKKGRMGSKLLLHEDRKIYKLVVLVPFSHCVCRAWDCLVQGYQKKTRGP